MARVRKGDTVFVLSGKDAGKTGKVLQVWPARERALVERINLLKHFDRRDPKNQRGGIVEREAALALSKLALFCSKCQKPSRVGVSVTGDQKQRICRRCKSIIA